MNTVPTSFERLAPGYYQRRYYKALIYRLPVRRSWIAALTIVPTVDIELCFALHLT